MKFIISILLLSSFLFPSEIIKNTENRIKEIFPDYLDIEHSKYQINSKTKKLIQNKVKQEFFRNEVNLWVIQNSDSLKYYAILDNVKGKSMPITFLTIFNHTGNVHTSSIIKYREAYGGEVAGKSWLNQFTNYTDTSNYKVGKAISGISGATISVHSVSKGIKKLSILIYQIMKDFDE